MIRRKWNIENDQRKDEFVGTFENGSIDESIYHLLRSLRLHSSLDLCLEIRTMDTV